MLLFLCMSTAAPAQKRVRQQAKPAKKEQQAKPSKKEQLQQQKKQVQQQRAANQKKQQQLEQQVKLRLQDVAALGSDIENKRAAIDSLRLGIDTLNRSIALLDSQLTVLNDDLEERRQHYIKSARYMYRNRKARNQMMFVLSAKNINQMYRRMRFMNEYTTYQRAQGEAVKQKSKQVSAKREELDLALDTLAGLLARDRQQQQQLQEKQAEQQRMVDDLQKQQQTVKKLITQQQQQEAELTKQINKIIAEEMERARKAEEERQRKLAAAEEQRRREQERQQQSRQANSGSNRHKKTNSTAASSSSKSSASTAYSSADPDRQLSGSFAGNKGRLPIPITGSYRVVRGFGRYTMAGVTLESGGVQLEGQTGAQARCVFDGEVIQVMYRPGNGYLVIVRHGQYMTVYCFLASVSVKQGQKVKINDTLGAVGTDHILHFRLHDRGTAVNPKLWIKRL